MARADFGGSTSDFVFTPTSGGLMRLSAATLTFWDAETGGTQYTDLLLNGVAVTQIPVGSDGNVPTFQGPDGVGRMWVSAGGSRELMVTQGKAGAPGAQGLPGVNAVPADNAVGTYVNTPGSATQQALSAAYVGLIQAAKNPDLLVTGAVTLDGSDQITSAAVKWPDGSPGTLTITSRDANGAVLAYKITYGSPVTKTFTQPAITRNANGAATNVPAIVVS